MATELIARFLSDEEIKMIHSISIVSREEILCLSYEVNCGNSKYNYIRTIPFAPNSPVKIDDIILPEQVVFVSIPNKIGKYAWRFGDQFSIEYYPYDSYTSRVLNGQLNREDYYRGLLKIDKILCIKQ